MIFMDIKKGCMVYIKPEGKDKMIVDIAVREERG